MAVILRASCGPNIQLEQRAGAATVVSSAASSEEERRMIKNGQEAAEFTQTAVYVSREKSRQRSMF